MPRAAGKLSLDCYIAPPVVDLRPYRKLHAIRMIADTIRTWWKLELAFADSKGYPIDHADGNIFPSGNEFCKLSLFTKEGFRRCNDSVKLVRDRLRGSKRRTKLIHQCHLGFDVIAAPIHLDGELVGFLFTGGAYHDEPTVSGKNELFRKVREFGSQETAKLDAGFREVPRLSDVELKHLANLVEFGAKEVMRAHAEKVGRRKSAEPPKEAGHRFEEIIGNSPAMRNRARISRELTRRE